MQQLTYFIFSLVSLVETNSNIESTTILVVGFGVLVFIFFAGKAIGVQKNTDESIKAFEQVGITRKNYYEIMELETEFQEHLKKEKKYKKLHRLKMWERQLYGFDGRWKRLEKKIKKPT